MTRLIDPARGRPEPGPPLGASLAAEVARLEQRLESARDDLRRWRISNCDDGKPSVYEKRGFLSIGDE
jgi:hypothetical protein